jgi:hypothetical protein
MRLIGAWSHAIIDYALAIIIFIAPSVAGFAGRQATMAYTLGTLLVILSLLTRYPLGILRAVRFPVHGAVELVIALLFLILPWLANFSRGIQSRNFYVLISVVMLAIWFMTDFRGIRDRNVPT